MVETIKLNSLLYQYIQKKLLCYQNKEAINERLTYKRKNDNILHALFKSNILIDYNDLLIFDQIVQVRNDFYTLKLF